MGVDQAGCHDTTAGVEHPRRLRRRTLQADDPPTLGVDRTLHRLGADTVEHQTVDDRQHFGGQLCLTPTGHAICSPRTGNRGHLATITDIAMDSPIPS